MDKFTKDATLWNKTHFVNIFANKKSIMARLNGIQRSVSIRQSSFLLNLEKDLLKDLDTILRQAEGLWAMKSRVNWMIQVEQNTALYHASTLIRRK